MPVCRCRVCARQKNLRQYSTRTIFRHRALYGLAEDAVADPPVLVEIGLNDIIDEPVACNARPNDPTSPTPFDQGGIFIGRQWFGSGRPPNAFFVPCPARLEFLLDFQRKHRLSSDFSLSFLFHLSLSFSSRFFFSPTLALRLLRRLQTEWVPSFSPHVPCL